MPFSSALSTESRFLQQSRVIFWYFVAKQCSVGAWGMICSQSPCSAHSYVNVDNLLRELLTFPHPRPDMDAVKPGMVRVGWAAEHLDPGSQFIPGCCQSCLPWNIVVRRRIFYFSWAEHFLHLANWDRLDQDCHRIWCDHSVQSTSPKFCEFIFNGPLCSSWCNEIQGGFFIGPRYTWGPIYGSECL